MLNRLAIVVAAAGLGAFLLAFVVVERTISFSLNPPSHAQHHAEGDNRNATEDCEAKSHKTIWQKTQCDPVAYFTLWLVGFTAVLAGSTIALWVITWRIGVRQSRELKILQRAYLSAEPLGVEPFGTGEQPVARIGFKNVGNLPARDVKWDIRIKMSSNGRLNDFPIDKASMHGNNVVPPGTEMVQGATTIFSVDEVQGFRGRARYVYVWGEVRYGDGFGEERFTKFCHRYGYRCLRDNANSLGEAVLSAGGARYHEHGNDAD